MYMVSDRDEDECSDAHVDEGIPGNQDQYAMSVVW